LDELMVSLGKGDTDFAGFHKLDRHAAGAKDGLMAIGKLMGQSLSFTRWKRAKNDAPCDGFGPKVQDGALGPGMGGGKARVEQSEAGHIARD
jgi:hypothetical protein